MIRDVRIFDLTACFISYLTHHTSDIQSIYAPRVKTDLAKTVLKYRGAIIWNAVLNLGIYSDTSESIFIKFLKLVVDTLLWKCTRFLYMYKFSLSLFWSSFFCYVYIVPDIRIPQTMSVYSLCIILDALMTVYPVLIAFNYLPQHCTC